MYRIYDKQLKCWVNTGVYLYFNKELLAVKKNRLFNALNLSKKNNERYILQQSIGLQDANKRSIFEGDIVKVEVANEENNTSMLLTGVVSYYPNHACYYFFDAQNKKYYPLTFEICKQMEVIGNIIESENILPS